MSFFDKIIKKLFPDGENQSTPSKLPVVTEQLKRSVKEQQHYKAWLYSEQHIGMTEKFSNAYWKKVNEIDSDIKAVVLDTPYSRGFAFFPHQSISDSDFRNFFDFLRDRMLEIGYRNNISDRRIFDRGSYVEAVEKHYLKPTVSYNELKQADQRYGNVLIELKSRDDKVTLLTLQSNIYAGRQYKEPLSFADLAGRLLTVE
ncbi:hypothetical protein V6R21_23240 [Limibacter armeniacum]|uniref:hypothetical protein n=1 Tax=Limibacter armeniacum TaxID=466084 RepID=UPI002FE5A985